MYAMICKITNWENGLNDFNSKKMFQIIRDLFLNLKLLSLIIFNFNNWLFNKSLIIKQRSREFTFLRHACRKCVSDIFLFLRYLRNSVRMYIVGLSTQKIEEEEQDNWYFCQKYADWSFQFPLNWLKTWIYF